MDTHEVLVAARNLLEREGWVQRRGVTENGRCAVGATGCVAGLTPESCPVGAFDAFREANNALAVVLRERGESARVVDWNDTPGRTKEEVLALFARAIALTAPAPQDPLKDIDPSGLGTQSPVDGAAGEVHIQEAVA